MAHIAQIETSYSGPTDTRGSRITARFTTGEHKGKRITVPYDYSARDVYIVAAIALVKRFPDTYSSGLDYVGTLNSGAGVYNAFPALMPAWIGEAI